ncbi:hypothetical protein ACRN9T_19090 [Shewanella baltica]|uniref:hypothetical protein n=1 Tax=Shewanella baltica TaxID=62322 RepID=UPI003D7B9063
MTQQFIETDHAVFCIEFSPDGLTLAAGTGSYYGTLNKLLLYPLTGINNGLVSVGEPQNVPLTHQKPHPKNSDSFKPEGLSATALYFTPDSKQLWVATSASYRGKGPLFCFDLSRNPLQLPIPIYLSGMKGTYPDGFVHRVNQLFVCGHGMSGHAEAYICHIECASDLTQSSSSPKMLLIDDQLITPGAPQHTLVQGIRLEKNAYKFGLSFVPAEQHDAVSEQLVSLESEERDRPALMQHYPSLTIPVEHAILCLAQQPDSANFTTGNTAGQFHHWWFEGQWCNRHIAPKQVPESTTPLLIKDSIFAQNCVVAIQYLPNNQGWLSLSANGMLIHWQGDEIVHYEQVSHLGTPRCMALHPTKPLLAIGLKHNAELHGAGIALVDIGDWCSGR